MREAEYNFISPAKQDTLKMKNLNQSSPMNSETLVSQNLWEMAVSSPRPIGSDRSMVCGAKVLCQVVANQKYIPENGEISDETKKNALSRLTFNDMSSLSSQHLLQACRSLFSRESNFTSIVSRSVISSKDKTRKLKNWLEGMRNTVKYCKDNNFLQSDITTETFKLDEKKGKIIVGTESVNVPFPLENEHEIISTSSSPPVSPNQNIASPDEPQVDFQALRAAGSEIVSQLKDQECIIRDAAYTDEARDEAEQNMEKLLEQLLGKGEEEPYSVKHRVMTAGALSSLKELIRDKDKNAQAYGETFVDVLKCTYGIDGTYELNDFEAAFALMEAQEKDDEVIEEKIAVDLLLSTDSMQEAFASSGCMQKTQDILKYFDREDYLQNLLEKKENIIETEKNISDAHKILLAAEQFKGNLLFESTKKEAEGIIANFRDGNDELSLSQEARTNILERLHKKSMEETQKCMASMMKRASSAQSVDSSNSDAHVSKESRLETLSPSEQKIHDNMNALKNKWLDPSGDGDIDYDRRHNSFEENRGAFQTSQGKLCLIFRDEYNNPCVACGSKSNPKDSAEAFQGLLSCYRLPKNMEIEFKESILEEIYNKNTIDNGVEKPNGIIRGRAKLNDAGSAIQISFAPEEQKIIQQANEPQKVVPRR